MVALSVLVYFWVVGNVTVADMAWPIISNEMGLPARAGILVTYVEDFSFMVSQDPHSFVRGGRGDATSFRSGRPHLFGIGPSLQQGVGAVQRLGRLPSHFLLLQCMGLQDYDLWHGGNTFCVHFFLLMN